MLTYLQLQNLKPKARRYEVTAAPGLLLRIDTNGRKTWILHKSVQRVWIVARLGEFPKIGIKEAQRLAEKVIKARLGTGDEDAQVTGLISLREVFEKWYEVKATRIRNHIDIKRRFDNYILPEFGSRQFGSIAAHQFIAAIQKTLGAAGKLETIKRLCGELRQLEVFALNCGYIESLKLQGLATAFASPQRGLVHRPSIPPAELPEVLHELHSQALKAPTTWAALLIGFYTLLRPGEYCAMRWDWIDGDVIRVPAEAMKMKRPFSAPVTPQLAAVLAARPHVNDYVLCSPDSPLGHIRIESLEVFLKRHGFQSRLVPHGIRSVGRTWMAENGVAYEVAEMCLAHAVGSQASLAYNRTDLLEERRAAMARWCEFVAGCL